MKSTEEFSPLRKGAAIPIHIDNVALGGDGVGRHDNQAVFVPFTAPGDDVSVIVTEVKKRYARGVIREIVKASPLRIAPRCPYFTRCGGCAYQHLSYPVQLAVKEGQIVETFRRLGGFADPTVAKIIPSPDPWHYRGKAEFFLRRVRKGPPRSGFLQAGSHTLIEIDRCEIVHETINAALSAMRRTAGGGGGRPGLHKTPIWSEDTTPILDFCSPEYLRRHVKGKTILTPCDGFFQANLYLVEQLVDSVINLCALTGTETVVDAYGGSGLFSLFLGPAARQIIGIEADVAAVQCACLNLEVEGLRNATFIAGDVEAVLAKMFVRTRRSVDVVLLDPPRTGCDAGVLEAMVKIRPPRIVYVSCNPATQARDCRLLIGHGYRLQRLQPLDMFPQTAHIETIGVLQLE